MRPAVAAAGLALRLASGVAATLHVLPAHSDLSAHPGGCSSRHPRYPRWLPMSTAPFLCRLRRVRTGCPALTSWTKQVCSDEPASELPSHSGSDSLEARTSPKPEIVPPTNLTTLQVTQQQHLVSVRLKQLLEQHQALGTAQPLRSRVHRAHQPLSLLRQGSSPPCRCRRGNTLSHRTHLRCVGWVSGCEYATRWRLVSTHRLLSKGSQALLLVVVCRHSLLCRSRLHKSAARRICASQSPCVR